jgi:hypothetical protein
MLQSLNAPRKGRLRQVQNIGRFAEASEIIDCEERSQIEQLEIDAHYASKSQIFAFVTERKLAHRDRVTMRGATFAGAEL